MPARAARRYARAFVGFARDSGALAAVRNDLAGLGAAVRDCPDLAAFLGDYTLPSAARHAVVEAALAPRVHPVTKRFLLFLEQRRRLGLLGDVCGAFAALLDLDDGVHRGTLDSAFDLSDAETEAIRSRLVQRTGAAVELRARAAPELLGGFRAQVGDTVYDFSLATMLDGLMRRMAAGGSLA
jgi:F-type H+-transporting ATPase subunit delta